MSRVKKTSHICIECGTEFPANPNGCIPKEYCHVRCKYAYEKKQRQAERDLKRMKVQLNADLKPLKCAYCSHSFVKVSMNQKYCSDQCTKDKVLSRQRELRAQQPKKKKATTQELAQRMDYARVKVNQGPSLKQYNSVRG